jgi:hypothetical protein
VFSVRADENFMYVPHSVSRGLFMRQHIYDSGTNLSSNNDTHVVYNIRTTPSKSIAKANEILLTGKRKSTWIAQL